MEGSIFLFEAFFSHTMLPQRSFHDLEGHNRLFTSAPHRDCIRLAVNALLACQISREHTRPLNRTGGNRFLTKMIGGERLVQPSRISIQYLFAAQEFNIRIPAAGL